MGPWHGETSHTRASARGPPTTILKYPRCVTGDVNDMAKKQSKTDGSGTTTPRERFVKKANLGGRLLDRAGKAFERAARTRGYDMTPDDVDAIGHAVNEFGDRLNRILSAPDEAGPSEIFAPTTDSD